MHGKTHNARMRRKSLNAKEEKNLSSGLLPDFENSQDVLISTVN